MRKGHPTRVRGADCGRRERSALGLLALVIGLGLLAGGRETAAYPQQQQAVDKPLQYEVSVVLKLIHVYVTDKKGNPVPDLAVSDFTVTDNGQPMTVTDFERRVLNSTIQTRPEVAEPEVKTELMAIPVPALRQAGRKFFFFFDFAFNNARGIVKAKKAALHFLDTETRPDDEIGILSYSMLKGVTVHEYLTRDQARIKEVVNQIGTKDIAGRANEIEQQYWLQVELPLTGQRKSDKPGELTPQEQAAASNLEAQRAEGKRIAESFILRLTSLAQSLRYIPGQKHFLFFSTGVPASMVYGNQAGNPTSSSLSSSVNRAKFDPGDHRLLDEVQEMHRQFGASSCVFYTFDTRESAKIGDLFAYDRQTFETGARDFASKEGVFQDSQSVFKNDKVTGLDSLRALSDSTGGKYYSNINMYEKNLDQVQSLTGTYYVLGFPINERWDGKYHEVKVEVKRKGCKVRAQVGYFNPKPFSEYTDLEKQLHLFDLALNERALSRMPDRVPMRALMTAAEGITRLAVLAKLPGEVMAKFSGKRLEFVAIFFDAKGEISDMVREEVDPSTLRGRDLAFAAGSTLKPGDYSCRLVIRDMDSGMSAVASAKATIPKPQITGLQFGTPLVLESQTGCRLVVAGAKRAKAVFPWAEIYPYDSSLFAPVLTAVPVGTPSLQAVIPCALPGAGEPDLAVTAALVNAASGERTPVAIARLDRAPQGPLEALTLEIPTAGLAPGTYFLHFYAQDKTTGSLGHAFTTLIVRQR
jgi:VWFA-related protein